MRKNWALKTQNQNPFLFEDVEFFNKDNKIDTKMNIL